LLPVVLTLGLPLAVIGWLAWIRTASRLDWALSAMLCAGIASYFCIVGPIWSWIGFGWRYLLPAAAVASILWSARGLRTRPVLPPARLRQLAPTLCRGAMVAAAGAVFVILYMAGIAPPAAVDLAFPFQEGRYAVAHGGGTVMLNYHRAVPAQAWAVDMVALNHKGRRAEGLLPEALDAYEIYGQPVAAPCDGAVSGVSDGAPDTPVGGANRALPAGNHVLLSCEAGGGITLLLAHLQPGSVVPAQGDRVRRGAVLGRIGNSGNSTEPHLHIHAVRGQGVALAEMLTTAEPAPLTFDGRFPVRNTIFTRTAPQ